MSEHQKPVEHTIPLFPFSITFRHSGGEFKSVMQCTDLANVEERAERLANEKGWTDWTCGIKKLR